VDTIFVGKDRAYNRRFQQMCRHYLVDPVACTPASGWEKGRVENQVGVLRRRFFVPRPKFRSFAELNAWLEDRCIAYANRMIQPSLQTLPPPKSRTNRCGQFIKTSAAKVPWPKRLKPTGNIGPDRSAVAHRSARNVSPI